MNKIFNAIASQIQFESCLLLFVSGVTFVEGLLSVISIVEVISGVC